MTQTCSKRLKSQNSAVYTTASTADKTRLLSSTASDVQCNTAVDYN